MLPRTRRRRKLASVGLAAALLLYSPVLSRCFIPPGGRSNGGSHAHGTGFFAGTGTTEGTGRGHVQRASRATPSGWALAWQWLPQGRKDCSHPRSSRRTVDRSRQKHSTRSSSARKAEDDGRDTPVASSSRSGVQVDPKMPPRMLSAKTKAQGRGDNVGGGGSNHSGVEVQSLVDLVKMIHASDNPVWELVRFEVWRSSPHRRLFTFELGSIISTIRSLNSRA